MSLTARFAAMFSAFLPARSRARFALVDAGSWVGHRRARRAV